VSSLSSLAADLEDVLLRFRGHAEDAETLRRVADDLYGLTTPGSAGTRYFVTERVRGELVVAATGRDLQPIADELREGQIVWEAAAKLICLRAEPLHATS
jgi:hypothetical protein